VKALVALSSAICFASLFLIPCAQAQPRQNFKCFGPYNGCITTIACIVGNGNCENPPETPYVAYGQFGYPSSSCVTSLGSNCSNVGGLTTQCAYTYYGTLAMGNVCMDEVCDLDINDYDCM
jgi:hypothetical protein